MSCGVSGGADSLALLVLAVAAGLEVTAVHVDHGIRPGSGSEAEVVKGVARTLGAGFRSETVVVPPGSDLEARARRARRAVLGPEVMTGHTADDQAATVLINLIRGAGPRGLAGMRPGPTKPILGLRRAETVALVESLGISPVVDESNSDPRFQRNRIRSEVLPLMADIADRDVVPLIGRAADHLRSLEGFVAEEARGLDPTDTRALVEAPEPLATEALRIWLTVDGYAPSQAELGRVWAVVRHEVTGCEISRGRRIRRTNGILRLESIG